MHGTLTGGPSLSAVQGWVEAPVTTLVTGNGRRDKDLNKAVITQPAAVRVYSSTPLNLPDYKIGGLSKFMGMFKMDPNIRVHIDLTFAAAARRGGPPTRVIAERPR